MVPVPAARSARPARLPRWLVLAVGALFVFIAGLCIPYARATRLDARLQSTTRALTAARLENTLVTAALEARQGHYDKARQLASDFFTRLDRAASDIPLRTDAGVGGLLAQRDTTITLLSRSAAGSVDHLERLIALYRAVIDDEAGVVGGGPRQ